jgi:hypothetical protein
MEKGIVCDLRRRRYGRPPLQCRDQFGGDAADIGIIGTTITSVKQFPVLIANKRKFW